MPSPADRIPERKRNRDTVGLGIQGRRSARVTHEAPRVDAADHRDLVTTAHLNGGEPRAIERLNAYREAGAQCLFAPGVTDSETIARLVRGVGGPLNILATAGIPPLPELAKLGVARVSLGSGPMRATLGLLTRIARELREQGSFSLMTECAMPYADANRLVGH